MEKITLVLPVFNEEDKIENNVNEVISFLKYNLHKFEVIIAENGSTDNTFNKALKISEENNHIKVIHIEEAGRGKALKEAFKQASAPDIIGYMDADLPFELEDYLDALNKLIKEKADIVIGSRNIPGAYVERPLIRYFLSRLFNFLVKIFLGLNISDSQCGIKILRKKKFLKIADKIIDNNWFFDTELIFWFNRSGYSIKEVPVNCKMGSLTKVKIVRDSWSMGTSILRLLCYRITSFLIKRCQVE